MVRFLNIWSQEEHCMLSPSLDRFAPDGCVMHEWGNNRHHYKEIMWSVWYGASSLRACGVSIALLEMASSCCMLDNSLALQELTVWLHFNSEWDMALATESKSKFIKKIFWLLCEHLYAMICLLSDSYSWQTTLNMLQYMIWYQL
jgi:hypothetical protein